MAPPSVVITGQAPFAFQEHRDRCAEVSRGHRVYTWLRTTPAQERADSELVVNNAPIEGIDIHARCVTFSRGSFASGDSG
jgi:hypothetical protein